MALEDLGPSNVFLQKILHQELPQEMIQSVALVDKKPAVKKGDNYMSNITRLTVEYTCNGAGYDDQIRKVVHFIMKEEPNAGQDLLNYIREGKFFDIEGMMLKEVVPRIEEVIGRKLGPKVFYTSREPQVIVMEDLAALGFKTKDRKLGFNAQEIFLVLENLADFHAASVLLNEQDSQLVSAFTQGFFSNPPREAYLNYIKSCVATISTSVRTWLGIEFISISEKILQRSNDIADRFMVAYQCDEDEFRVLNHGDMWINNIMIREDENGAPEAVRLVDFQVPIWTSPAIDLLYFLSMSPQPSLKVIHDDIFLQKYLTRLTSTMKNINCATSPPTLEQLKISMLKRRCFAVMGGICIWPKILGDDEEIDNMDDILDKGECAVDSLKYPVVREVMERILPLLDERGYLD